MALEAVVFPQDLFSHNSKELYFGGPWSYDFGALEEEEKRVVVSECEIMAAAAAAAAAGGGNGGVEEKGQGQGKETIVGAGLGHGNRDPASSNCTSMVHNFQEWDVNNAFPETCTVEGVFPGGIIPAAAAAAGRRKRRRTKSCKNKEEVENQRMTHIAVERNRRKQMNEYLAVLRSLMPASYVQRGDQASIIGGAINFVKELEQLLQSLEAQKRIKQSDAGGGFSSPFAGFFTFPQYTSSCSSSTSTSCSRAAGGCSGNNEAMAPESRSAVADIEVTMVESHANLKILSRRRPKQLLKMVVGLQNLRLTTLHLNVTTIHQMALYSFSVKVEDDCGFTSVDEIATAVYQMLGRIRDEAGF